MNTEEHEQYTHREITKIFQGHQIPGDFQYPCKTEPETENTSVSKLISRIFRGFLTNYPAE